jgi:hypothetical protein
MGKKVRASLIAFGKKRAFNTATPVLVIASGTMGTNITKKGVIAIAPGSTTGALGGNVYLSINTAGTGTKINA